MKIRDGVEVNDERLAELCRHHDVVELAAFGSVLRDDFRADSDIDVLVTFAPGAAPAWAEPASPWNSILHHRWPGRELAPAA